MIKNAGFFLFFTIVLSLYSLVNFYILRRGMAALHDSGWLKSLVFWTMLLLMVCYPASRFLERSAYRELGVPLLHIGAYYLAMMIFMFFLLLSLDLIRLLNAPIHFLPERWHLWKGPYGAGVYLLLLATALGLTTAGAWNARHLQVRRLALILPKKQGVLDSVRLVLASDIHIGALIPPRRFRTMVQTINEQNPDVVLIAGDLFDEDVTRLDEKELVASLAGLQSRYGNYAILGNHDYFAGVATSISLMERGGLRVLRENYGRVADSFYLLGRDDRQGTHWGGNRTPLHKLAATMGQDLPVITMDHQPFVLREAQDAGVALQLSGHTHHGQIWPFNYLTRSIYEISWGYGVRGDTQFYVSCGAGTWGPPVRLGNRPEIVVIDIKFQ